MDTHILLVEDEADLGNVVKQYLEVSGFTVDWCKTGKEALEKFRTSPSSFDVAILDIGLPGMDGFELAKHLIEIAQDVSFLFLTARTEKTDRLLGLRLGADDYITKPFDIDELVLRIKNILKRKNNSGSGAANPVITLGDLSYNREALQLTVAGRKSVLLTPREGELLGHLLSQPDKVLKREEILTQLWGEDDYFLGRSLDVFISRLRKYLSDSKTVSINNIYGVGFMLTVGKE